MIQAGISKCLGGIPLVSYPADFCIHVGMNQEIRTKALQAGNRPIDLGINQFRNGAEDI
jgi:hypothetical protein